MDKHYKNYVMFNENALNFTMDVFNFWQLWNFCLPFRTENYCVCVRIVCQRVVRKMFSTKCVIWLASITRISKIMNYVLLLFNLIPTSQTVAHSFILIFNCWFFFAFFTFFRELDYLIQSKYYLFPTLNQCIITEKYCLY